MKRARQGAKIAAWASCLWLSSSGVDAGDVRGSVRAGEEAKAKPIEAVRSPYWQEWNGFIDPKKPTVDYARDVSAALIGPAASRDATTIALRDGTLSPTTIVVQNGLPLRVRNEDDFAHELYVEGLKGFEPLSTAPGQTRTLQMEQTGVFVVRDKLSPHVRATLHVIAKLTQVVNPNAEGSFTFKDVPPGPYVVKLYRGANEIVGSEFEVASTRELVLDPVSLDGRPLNPKPGK